MRPAQPRHALRARDSACRRLAGRLLVAGGEYGPCPSVHPGHVGLRGALCLTDRPQQRLGKKRPRQRQPPMRLAQRFPPQQRRATTRGSASGMPCGMSSDVRTHGCGLSNLGTAPPPLNEEMEGICSGRLAPGYNSVSRLEHWFGDLARDAQHLRHACKAFLRTCPAWIDDLRDSDARSYRS